MLWRLLLAIVLLVVVVGGIVGFNLFRDRMIAGFFAGMEPPPVTVSVIEAEPITWTPGIEAIGTASALRGVDLGVEAGGIVQEIRFRANDRVEAGQQSSCRSTTAWSGPTSRRPRPSSTSAASS